MFKALGKILSQESDNAVDIVLREGLLFACSEVFQLNGSVLHLGFSVDREEWDGFPVGIVELLLELGCIGVDLDGDAAFAQCAGDGQDIQQFAAAHIGEEHACGGFKPCGELVQTLEHVVDAVGTEAYAHAGHVRKSEDTGEVVVAPAAADAADGEVEGLDLEDCPGVIIEAAGKREVDLDGRADAGGSDQAEELFELVQALEAGLRDYPGSGTAVHQRPHGCNLGGVSAGEEEDGFQHGHRLRREALAEHLLLDCIQTDLVELVDGHGDVHHLVRESAYLCGC